MLIGIDLDDVLVELTPGVLQWTGIDLSEYSTDKAMPPKDREVVEALFSDPSFMFALDPVYGAKRTLQRWHDYGYRIRVITGRVPSVAEITRQYVNQHFPEVGEVFVVGGHFDSAPKKERIKGCDVWIDDSPNGVELAMNLNIPVFMVHNQWTGRNKHLIGAVGVTTVTDITQVDLSTIAE